MRLFFNPWNIFLRLILLNPFYKIRNLILRIGKKNLKWQSRVLKPDFWAQHNDTVSSKMETDHLVQFSFKIPPFPWRTNGIEVGLCS